MPEAKKTVKKNSNRKGGPRRKKTPNRNAATKPGNNRPNNRKRHNQNRNRRPKTLTPSRILQKYDNLMEQYINARKKFFEIYGRGNNKQLNKVERNYQTALDNLRKFESTLKEDWQKEVLSKKIDAYPADRQFSSEHDLKPQGDEVSFVGEFEDPHLLEKQKSHSWSEDTEESIGTIDDYNAYKSSLSN